MATQNANGKSTSTTDFNGSVLRYPLLNTGRYDYLSIASYKNEPDRFDTNTAPSANTSTAGASGEP